jgi:hypothetical protein
MHEARPPSGARRFCAPCQFKYLAKVSSHLGLVMSGFPTLIVQVYTYNVGCCE